MGIICLEESTSYHMAFSLIGLLGLGSADVDKFIFFLFYKTIMKCRNVDNGMGGGGGGGRRDI